MTRRIFAPQEKRAIIVKKRLNGTIGGRSKVATPVVPRFVPRVVSAPGEGPGFNAADFTAPFDGGCNRASTARGGSPHQFGDAFAPDQFGVTATIQHFLYMALWRDDSTMPATPVLTNATTSFLELANLTMSSGARRTRFVLWATPTGDPCAAGAVTTFSVVDSGAHYLWGAEHISTFNNDPDNPDHYYDLETGSGSGNGLQTLTLGAATGWNDSQLVIVAAMPGSNETKRIRITSSDGTDDNGAFPSTYNGGAFGTAQFYEYVLGSKRLAGPLPPYPDGDYEFLIDSPDGTLTNPALWVWVKFNVYGPPKF